MPNLLDRVRVNKDKTTRTWSNSLTRWFGKSSYELDMEQLRRFNKVFYCEEVYHSEETTKLINSYIKRPAS